MSPPSPPLQVPAGSSPTSAVTDGFTEGWSEILPFVYNCCNEQQESIKILGFVLLKSLSDDIGEDIVLPAIQPLFPLFETALSQGNSLDVRCACLSTASSFAPHLSDAKSKQLQAKMQSLLPPMLAVMHDAFQSGDREKSRMCLTALIELTAQDPAFVKPSIEQVLSSAYAVTGVRHLSGVDR
eukprot:761404-Hanusia_phi.AAC.7